MGDEAEYLSDRDVDYYIWRDEEYDEDDDYDEGD